MARKHKASMAMAVRNIWRYLFFTALGLFLGLSWPIDVQVPHVVCPSNLSDVELSTLPTIFVITPTYTRLTQRADMTRLSNTLRNVAKVHWVVVEDNEAKTRTVAQILQQCGLWRTTHLNVATPKENAALDGMGRFQYHRGVDQRNLALNTVASMAEPNGVVYFADDDNAYDLQVFEEMRHTKKVSIWPVAFVGGQRYERPIVTDGKVTGWHASWHPERAFPTDMASFAFNVSFLHGADGVPQFSHQWRKGFLETEFLSQLLSGPHELEPKADMCRSVRVWHTRTEVPNTKRDVKMPPEPWFEV